MHHHIRKFIWPFVFLVPILFVFSAQDFHKVKQAQEDFFKGFAWEMPREESKGTLDFSHLELEAQSVLVVDLTDGRVLYEKDPDTSRPLASLVELVTALVSLEYTAEERIAISEEAVRQAGDTGVKSGELWDAKNLTAFMLQTSSNDAAFAIAEHITEPVFEERATMLLKELGISGIGLHSPTGLDTEDMTPTAWGSTRDIMKLLSYGVEHHPDVFLASALTECSYLDEGNNLHQAVNTNILTRRIPGLLVSKTGYTQAAGGNLAFIFEAGPHHPVAVVLLGSSFQGRFADAEEIVQETLGLLTKSS